MLLYNLILFYFLSKIDLEIDFEIVYRLGFVLDILKRLLWDYFMFK